KPPRVSRRFLESNMASRRGLVRFAQGYAPTLRFAHLRSQARSVEPLFRGSNPLHAAFACKKRHSLEWRSSENKVASLKGRIANHFSTILRVDQTCEIASLTTNGQKLAKSKQDRSKEILSLLDRVDSWHERMSATTSVTQSMIAKEEG